MRMDAKMIAHATYTARATRPFHTRAHYARVRVFGHAPLEAVLPGLQAESVHYIGMSMIQDTTIYM